MNFDFFFSGNTLFNKEECEFLSEVTLKLNNDSLLFIFDTCAIAMEHFLECTNEFFVVQVILQTLDNCQAFAASSLLIMQVNNVVLTLLLLEVGLVLSTEVDHV